MKRMENPRIVPLAWYREAWEEQEDVLGPDPWEYGLGENNAKQLAMLVQFSHEQGLISRPIPSKSFSSTYRKATSAATCSDTEENDRVQRA